jgi:flagellar basal-body rod protein FlgC
MTDPLRAASNVAASGLFAQSLRLRVVAENIANAQSTGKSPGADPYRRKTIVFSQELDAVTGANLVTVAKVGRDPSSFPVEMRPGHPAADASGMVKFPNVNMIVEMADMREATRSYEANLQVIRQSREMANAMIDLLRSTA